MTPHEFLLVQATASNLSGTRDDLLYLLGEDLPEAEGLDLTNAPWVTRHGLENLRRWPNLKYLQVGASGLSGHCGYSVSDLETLVFLRGLTHLSVQGPTREFGRVDRRTALTIADLPNLEFLSCQTREGAGVATAFMKLDRLHTLRIGGMRDLGAWFETIRQMRLLERLRLYPLNGLEDEHLAEIGVLANLRELLLSGCNNLSDTAISSLSDCTRLENLTLMGTANTNVTDMGISRLSRLPLKSLTLMGFEGLTGAGLRPILRLPDLEELVLHECTSLGPEAVQALAEVGHRVTIGIGGSPLLTEAVLKELEARNSNLEFRK